MQILNSYVSLDVPDIEHSVAFGPYFKRALRQKRFR